MTSSWETWELEIAEALALKVSLLSVQQIARGWLDCGSGVAANQLRRLTVGGLLDCFRVNIQVLEAKSSILEWVPGQACPDFLAISERLKGRWCEAALPMQVYCASRKTANLFGSRGGSLPPQLHRNHDLLLSDAYVQYRITEPKVASLWVGEHALPKAGYQSKDPDAFIIDGDRTLRVIESGGAYSAKQVESFHEYCVDREIPYEIW